MNKNKRREVKQVKQIPVTQNPAYTAGQKAFLIGVDIQNNPYSGAQRNIWAKGFLEIGAKYPPKERLPYGTLPPERPYVARRDRVRESWRSE